MKHFEKYIGNMFIVLFAVIAVMLTVGGFYGNTWCFYTAAMAAFISGAMYAASKENLNLNK